MHPTAEDDPRAGHVRTWAFAVIAWALCWWAPGSFDSERWSRYDPRWLIAAGVLSGCYILLLVLVSGRLQARPPRLAAALPLVLAAPSVILKPAVTDLPGLAGIGFPWLLAQAGLLSMLGGLAAAGGATAPRSRAFWAAAWVALLGPLLWAGLRYGELSAREEIIAGGGVEEVLRDLARRVGDDYRQNGLPPADLATWSERLRAPGWHAYEGGLYYAPDPEVGPGPLRVHYVPPEPNAPPWTIILRAEALPLLRLDSRRFTADLSLDGAIAWSWPEGPPRAIAERRRTVEER